LDHKKHFAMRLLGYILVVLVIMFSGILIGRAQPQEFAGISEQQKFLKSHGFLVGDENAFEYYQEAITFLNSQNITKEYIKGVKPGDPLFIEAKERLLPLFYQGAKQREMKIPEPGYWHEVIEYNGKQIKVSDIYTLCYGFLLKSLKHSADTDSPDLGYICLAFGTQLSKYYGHEVLYGSGIALKYAALEWLIAYHEREKNPQELSTVTDLFENVKNEFEMFKKQLKNKKWWHYWR